MRRAKAQPKKLTGFQRKLLDIIKSAENTELAYYRRRRISRRALRAAGKLGVDEDKGIGAIKREILVSPEYARELLHTLYDEGFLRKSKLGKYTLSETAIQSIGYALQKMGYVRAAVRQILHRDMVRRGYIAETLREHKAPRKTPLIPPIIGFFGKGEK